MKYASSLLLLLVGCGYSSQYRPPADGRARVLWNDDHLVSNLASLVRTQECYEATWWLRHPSERSDRTPEVAPLVWVPRYYGPDIVVLAPGVAPVPSRAVLRLSPPLALAHGLADFVPPGRLDKDLAILMIVAIAVLPIIDVTFSALRPEADADSADAVDGVNAYNDLARSAGNPCSP